MKIGSMGIIRKITIIYIVTIILPISLITGIVYYQFYESEKDAIQRYQTNSINLVTEKLDYIVSVTDNLSSIILRDRRLRRYLTSIGSSAYYSGDEYSYLITPLFEYSLMQQMVKYHSTTIFMHRDNIDEVGYMFVQDEVLDNQYWYSSFLRSEDQSMWLPPMSKATLMGEEEPEGGRRVITHLQKIHGNGSEYVATLAIHIYEEEFFRIFRQFFDEQHMMHVISVDGEEVYSSNEDLDVDTGFIKTMINNGQDISFIRDRYIYTYKYFEDINMYIGVVTGIESPILLSDASILAMFLVSLILLALIILFYRYLRNVFKLIQGKINQVNNIILDDFKERLPIEREDEIGDISRSFNVLLDKINALIRDVVSKETAQKDANLKALQYQINPHFIYNTIEVFNNKMELAGEYETSDALAAFGKMLRYNLKSTSSFTTVKEEIVHVNGYLQIEKLRYEDNLTCNMYYSKDLENTKIIKFILQPIIENCFIHGFKQFSEHMYIDINIISQEGYIHFAVADNGHGLSQDRIDLLNHAFKTSDYGDERLKNPESNSIGLRNINERLKLFYNDHCYINLSLINNHTVVSFRLPILSE